MALAMLSRFLPGFSENKNRQKDTSSGDLWGLRSYVPSHFVGATRVTVFLKSSSHLKDLLRVLL